MRSIATPTKAQTETTKLELRDLSIGYRPSRKQRTVVAKNITTTLRAGDLVCLLGPNGAGKSTLMRTMAGMQKPLGGVVILDGVNIHELPSRELAKKLSVVLTERISIGAMTAYSLVALGRYPHTNWAGALGGKDHEVIQWALQTTGALEFAHRQIGELSDGERQKVMVARALAQEPQLMILDEITAFLDLPRRVEIMRMLRDLAHKTKRAILLSTHDLDLALRSADHIWLLPKNGEMKIGAPEDLVLSGSFETAFASEGVEFDQQTGSFHIAQPEAGTVAIIGEGIGEGEEAFWTRRALERNGFRIDRDAPTRVEILTQNGAAKWRMTAGGESREFVSLDALISEINS